MSLPSWLAAEIEDRIGESVTGATAVGGGSINQAWRVDTAGGGNLFVKTRSGAGADEFLAEAAGLRWLAEGGGRVPRVVAVGGIADRAREETGRAPEASGIEAGWLALEWIESGRLGADGEESLGRELAELHASGAETHGALPPDSPAAEVGVGSLRLATSPMADWNSFYRDQRLVPLVRMARESGAIGESNALAVESVCARIDDLAGPSEPPSRLHGDLWSGNVHAGHEGLAWLIDPTAYGGHREMDLAMLKLFGGPSQRTYDAYHETAPLADGFDGRISLWQLQPLLTHAVLFGGHYGAAAGRAAGQYL